MPAQKVAGLLTERGGAQLRALRLRLLQSARSRLRDASPEHIGSAFLIGADVALHVDVVALQIGRRVKQTDKVPPAQYVSAWSIERYVLQRLGAHIVLLLQP